MKQRLYGSPGPAAHSASLGVGVWRSGLGETWTVGLLESRRLGVVENNNGAAHHSITAAFKGGGIISVGASIAGASVANQFCDFVSLKLQILLQYL